MGTGQDPTARVPLYGVAFRAHHETVTLSQKTGTAFPRRTGLTRLTMKIEPEWLHFREGPQNVSPGLAATQEQSFTVLRVRAYGERGGETRMSDLLAM